jgi:hypothetical protein
MPNPAERLFSTPWNINDRQNETKVYWDILILEMLSSFFSNKPLATVYDCMPSSVATLVTPLYPVPI